MQVSRTSWSLHIENGSGEKPLQAISYDRKGIRDYFLKSDTPLTFFVDAVLLHCHPVLLCCWLISISNKTDTNSHSNQIMSSSSSSVARGSLYRPYGRSTSTGSISSVENLPPRTIARVSKEVRDLMKKPPGGINLVVDPETGMPASLGEIVVSLISWQNEQIGRGHSFSPFLWQLTAQVAAISLALCIDGVFLEKCMLMAQQNGIRIVVLLIANALIILTFLVLYAIWR